MYRVTTRTYGINKYSTISSAIINTRVSESFISYKINKNLLLNKREMHTNTNLSIPILPPPINENNTILIVCDIQETFRNYIHEFTRIVSTGCFIINSFKTLGIPIIVTEQEPFKATVTELNTLLQNTPKVHHLKKTKFSIVDDRVKELLQSYNVEHIVIIGIESHICVQQSVLDLLRLKKYNINLVSDGISAQDPKDSINVVQRLIPYGVNISSGLSIIYEILKDAKHPKFKEIFSFYKKYNSSSNKL